MSLFLDRRDAGHRLGQALERYRPDDPVVVALPRGGVTVGFEVARALGAPLEILVVRKLGAPRQPELAIGAVGPERLVILNANLAASLGVSQTYLDEAVESEFREVKRRLRVYRGSRPPLDVEDRTVLLVDDGIATGATTRAAVEALRRLRPRKLVLAVPVAPPHALDELRPMVDVLLCLEEPAHFDALNRFYESFPQVSDEEVNTLLSEAAAREAEKLPLAAHASAPPLRHSREIRIPAGPGTMAGLLEVPSGAIGMVIFAHGSGSGRYSPRNQAVATALVNAGLGALLVDLLTPEEAAEDAAGRGHRFNVALLAKRLGAAALWIARQPETQGLPVGLFGSSTGAAAALVAAGAGGPGFPPIAAVVSRGGRVDLAGRSVAGVRAPTLLVVGSEDPAVLAINEVAYRELRCPKELRVIAGAGHLFEEPGALEKVAGIAASWFAQHLARASVLHPADGPG